MSNLHRIQQRHRPDRLQDLIFVGVAVLLTALSLGALTSQAAGHVSPRQWTLTVLESGLEVGR